MIAKRTLKKYLFQLRVPLSYKQCVGTFEAVRNDGPLPKGIESDEIMVLKKVLQTYRTKANTIDKNLVQLERELVEKAAEMGNNDAIAMLAGEVLQDKDANKEDRDHADSLLIQLMNQQYPLAFKVSGDIAYQAGKRPEAKKFYEYAVEHGIKDAALVECLRSIGLISFMDRKVGAARQAFQKAIDQSDDPSKVMDCHFYLGQIFESNKDLARYHFERAASFGLKEAFAPLGFLNLNYYSDPSIAEEWFKLGREVGDINCLVGLLDIYCSQTDLKPAIKILELIKKSPDADKVLELRREKVTKVEEFVTTLASDTFTNSTVNDRWGF